MTHGTEQHSPLSDCEDHFPMSELAVQCTTDPFWAPNSRAGTHARLLANWFIADVPP